MTDQGLAKIEAFLKKANPEKAKDYPYKFKFVVITGGAEKSCVVDAAKLTVGKSDGSPVDVTFRSDLDVLNALLEAKTTLEEAIKSGKITIEGDMEIAKKLKPFFTQ